MPSEQFQTAFCHLTISNNGQRGRTLNAPASLPVFKCIAPAKAIIAPLSVQYAIGGKNTSTFSSRFFGLPFCTGSCIDKLPNVSRSFQFAPTPHATTNVLNPVCNKAFFTFAVNTSTTAS